MSTTEHSPRRRPLLLDEGLNHQKSAPGGPQDPLRACSARASALPYDERTPSRTTNRARGRHVVPEGQGGFQGWDAAHSGYAPCNTRESAL